MTTSFIDRLAYAHALVARGLPAAPVHVADQFLAASADTRTLHDRIGVLMPILEPGRHWRRRLDPGPSDETRAYLLAALLGCTAVCPHLKRGGPQPAIVRLPLHRTDCERCIGTLRRPPPDEDDRCDVCAGRGVEKFWPFAARLGAALIAGDACPSCAGVLGIRHEAAS